MHGCANLLNKHYDTSSLINRANKKIMDPEGSSKISGELEVSPDTSAQNPDTSSKTGPDKGGFSINLDRIQEVLPDEQVCIVTLS